MADSQTMSAAPVAIIDVLNSLVEAEVNSIFRFMDESSPYLSRATAEVRRPLAEMVKTNERQAGELSELIESLGGYPSSRAVEPEEQYLAFLSLRFLLPKLLEAKALMIRRYEAAIGAIPSGAPAEVGELLNAHLAEHREQYKVLEKAAAAVAASA